MVGLLTINERADTRHGKESKRTNELIIIIYTLRSSYHSHLSSSLHSNFKLLCLVFQVGYHLPLTPISEITKSLKGTFETFPSISHTGLWIPMPRIKVPCAQINLGNKAHHVAFSDIQNSHSHNKRLNADRTSHPLILSSPSSFKII